MTSARIPLLAIALVLAGCGTPPTEVVPLKASGTFRAPTYFHATLYCEKQGATMQAIGNGPAQTGVEFRCER
ncbi:MAG: hypothetical protein ABWZ88_17165 [Variovorax sp.]